MPNAPVRRLPDLTPYRSIPTPELNRALDEIERGAQLTAEAPLVVASVPSGFHLLLDQSREPFWAKIASGTNPYAWAEQYPTAAGTWADTPRGRTGTTTFRPAYERNDNAAITAGTVVRLYPVHANAGGAEQEYTFDGGGPAGPSGSGSINVRETNEGGGTGTTLITGVTEFGTDLGEITNAGGGVVRQGFSGRQVAFDSALGDSLQSIAGSSYFSPVTVTFPNDASGNVATRFSSAEFDTASGAPSGIIATLRNGIYQLAAAVEWDSNATGYRYCAVVDSASGAVVSGIKDMRAAYNGDRTMQCVGGPSFLGSGNYQFDLVVAQNSGGALNLVSAWLSAVKIG